MQAATTLPIDGDPGLTGVTVGTLSRGNGTGPADYELVKVILRVPTLNAGVHTVATSDDGGVTWLTATGPIALTGSEPANPTAAGNTGGYRALYGPYLPGTKFRLTSSVAQTASATVRFGI
jgi:hypothetical protein